MNLIRPSYEIIEQGPGIQGVYDIIEIAGKTSYKSKIEGGETAKKFVKMRAKEGHYAVLEFGTVYLHYEWATWTDPASVEANEETQEALNFYRSNKYSKVVCLSGTTHSDFYITTNYRVIVENHRESDLVYMSHTPSEHHEKRYCVRFILDRFTGEEFLRHRVFSFCRESTRYCNYSKSKFNNSITFVIPPWIPETELAEGNNVAWWDGDWVNMEDMSVIKYGDENSLTDKWLHALDGAERCYMLLTQKEKNPWVAQQARTILPCAIKSPLVMCGFADDWKHFFDLRALGTTGAPHPQAKELAEPLMKEFIERDYLKYENRKEI